MQKDARHKVKEDGLVKNAACIQQEPSTHVGAKLPTQHARPNGPEQDIALINL